jgi:gentisate 1,2-dioxygenase
MAPTACSIQAKGANGRLRTRPAAARVSLYETATGQPTVTPALEELYRGFERQLLVPLWTEIGDLMPAHPRSRALPHLWRWENLRNLAAKAGELVPVGRGGERRAIALANPGLGGRPFATPTLWAAIQYLMPGEDAPEHRHTQHAFRFVIEGEGVWTGGDVLPTIRVEMHRIARGTQTAPVRETGSSVCAVFDGSGTVTVGDTTWPVTRGDLFVVPSWQPFSVRSEAGATDSDSGALDLFRFSDSPVFEALRLDRRHTEGAEATEGAAR